MSFRSLWNKDIGGVGRADRANGTGLNCKNGFLIMTEVSKTCPTCLKPKTAPSSGFVTQFLGVCRCAELARYDNQAESLKICGKCGKAIGAQRAGSLTQWVFRSDRCECEEPEPIEAAVATHSPGELAAIDIDAAEELPLRSENFPTARYKPLARLGAGASGEVYLAADRMLGKKVAVKILHQLTAQQLIAFQAEARMTSKLKHPCTIQVLDFGPTEAGEPYMVLEYLDNAISLETYITDNGPLPVDLALLASFKICEGLAHAHEMDVLHRDLKPSNVLLSDTKSGDPHVKLIDFGVATLKHDMQESTLYQGKTIVGTPAYMAPEQVLGGTYDVRSEIYSLGCVLFEALTGRAPFSGETALEVMSHHVNRPCPTMQAICGREFPRELEAIVARCLAKNKEDRPPSVGTVKRKLLSIQSKAMQDIDSPRPGADAAGVLVPAKRERKYVVLAIVLTTLATLVAVPFLIHHLDSDKPLNRKSAGKKARVKNSLLDTRIGQVPGDEKQSNRSDSRRYSHPLLDQDQWNGKQLEISDSALRTIDPSEIHRNYAGIHILNSVIVRPSVLEAIGSFPSIQSIKIEKCTRVTPQAMSFLNMGLSKTNRKGSAHGFWLDFTNSDLTDDGLDYLKGQSKLRALILEGTKITDAGLKRISKMNKLRAIDVSHTAITDDGIESLKNMEILILLRAQDCPNLSKSKLASLDKRITVLSDPIHFGPNVEFALNSLAAQHGNVEAQFELGTRYHTGAGIDIDYKQAIYWYKKAASQGNTLAANNLGSLYMAGQGVARDGKEAMKWFHVGADKGEKTAQNNIGVLYMEGIGFEKDYTKALEWFLKSAKQGFTEAQNNVGVAYENGHGVKQDYAKAFEWYSKAMAQGDPTAQCNLGGMYEAGHGMPVDSKKAMKYFRQAAEKGVPKGQYNIGALYYLGHGVPKDYKLAMEWFQLAAEQNDPAAEYNIGQLYFDGQGVEKNKKEALSWYKKSADHGFAIGQTRMAYIYEIGDGLEKDYGKAMEWYQLAAKQGFAIAQFRLGYLFENGLGVPKDREQAIKWYRIAAQGGQSDALEKLKKLGATI